MSSVNETESAVELIHASVGETVGIGGHWLGRLAAAPARILPASTADRRSEWPTWAGSSSAAEQTN